MARAHDERERQIREAKQFQKNLFWCSLCHEDFETVGIKIVQRGWKVPIAFYEAKCPCGKYCRRRITDKNNDEYWYRSALMAIERKRHRIDTLQPGDPDFDRYYPQHKKKLMEQEDQRERANYQTKIMSTGV